MASPRLLRVFGGPPSGGGWPPLLRRAMRAVVACTVLVGISVGVVALAGNGFATGGRATSSGDRQRTGGSIKRVAGDAGSASVARAGGATTGEASALPSGATHVGRPGVGRLPSWDPPPLTVEISLRGVSPSTLWAHVGSEVVFVNADQSATHDWVWDGFDTGALGPGQEYRGTMVRPGTYVFHCKVHGWLSGTVQVPDLHENLRCGIRECTATWS